MDLRYPIGKCTLKAEYTQAERAQYIAEIEAQPARLITLVKDYSEAQLETQYRLEGWTVRQVIHHLPDSHANALIRFKLALTEENPTIKPYMEHLWAELPDGKSAPIEISLNLLSAIHARLVYVLKNMSDKDFARTYIHPEHGKVFTLAQVLHNYGWHGEHHYQHIYQLHLRSNW